MHPGDEPFAHCRVWVKNLNRFFYPQLIPEKELISLVGLTHIQLWDFSMKFSEPFLQQGGQQGRRRYKFDVNNVKVHSVFFRKPHRMTRDSLSLLFLLKIHEGLSNRLLSTIFGNSESAIGALLNDYRDFVWRTDEWLQRTRNLSDIT